jgi:MFS family permease
MIVKKVGAGRYLPFLCVCYGLVCTCIGFVKSYKGLLVARFFLGLSEGGLGPGIALYLSMFYRKDEQALRIASFFCAAPAAGAIGGLLASGLSSIHVGSYKGWPWIFFVEGMSSLPTLSTAYSDGTYLLSSSSG